MKHWDLRPGETVTLASRGTRIDARFQFRDTLRAAFLIDREDGAHLRIFSLRDDGDLSEKPSTDEIIRMINELDYISAEAARRRHWTIEGADRNTRGRL